MAIIQRSAVDITNAGNMNTNPGRKVFLLVANDTQDQAYVTRQIRIGSTGGNLVFLAADEEDTTRAITWPVQAYETIDIQARMILTTTTVPAGGMWGIV